MSMPTPEKKLLAGWSEIEFTPAPGLNLLGQMHPRIATHARDPLCAIAAAFAQGDVKAVLVACDICILDNDFIAQTQQRWQQETELAASTLLIHATHTHVAPVATALLMDAPGADFPARLQDAILEAAHTALKRLEPVEVFASTGQLEHLGWNRRAMFDDGTSRMYGHSKDPGFIGMEGPRDPSLPVLWTKNSEGKITGVLTGFATHPNCMESECFYSADLPGASRKYLKKFLGDDCKALYLTGAAGNTAPSVLDPYDATQPWRGDAGVERSGLYLAGEAAKIIASTLEPMSNGVLALQRAELEIPLRQWPQPDEVTYPSWPGTDYYALAEQAWPERMKTNSPFPVSLNALRIGEAAICTNPAELFVEFGLEIKANSPARVTFISELTDGYCGYVPTPIAFSRGGYETWCAPSSQMSLDTGERIVTATRRLLKQMWD